MESVLINKTNERNKMKLLMIIKWVTFFKFSKSKDINDEVLGKTLLSLNDRMIDFSILF